MTTLALSVDSTPIAGSGSAVWQSLPQAGVLVNFLTALAALLLPAPPSILTLLSLASLCIAVASTAFEARGFKGLVNLRSVTQLHLQSAICAWAALVATACSK